MCIKKKNPQFLNMDNFPTTTGYIFDPDDLSYTLPSNQYRPFI